MTIFYKNFLALCAKHNKTPSGVAAAIGLSNAAASGWKNGKIPSDLTVKKIANYFQCGESELTENDDMAHNISVDLTNASIDQLKTVCANLDYEKQFELINYLWDELKKNFPIEDSTEK